MHEKVWNSFCTRLDELPKFNLTKSTKDLAGPEYGEFTLVCKPLFPILLETATTCVPTQ